MLFCPTCANLLLIEKAPADFRFYCKTCPYIFVVKQSFENKMHLDRKQVDDVLGGKDAFVGAKEATVQEGCRECGHKKAYFMEIQIRSADEPMTIFFRCVDCAY